jgi:hypothetical protein
VRDLKLNWSEDGSIRRIGKNGSAFKSAGDGRPGYTATRAAAIIA